MCCLKLTIPDVVMKQNCIDITVNVEYTDNHANTINLY